MTLRLADGVAVHSQGRYLGDVQGSGASAIRDCIDRGYAFHGTVRDVDRDGSAGTLVVVGTGPSQE